MLISGLVSAERQILVHKEDDVYHMVEQWIKTNGQLHCVLVDEVQF